MLPETMAHWPRVARIGCAPVLEKPPEIQSRPPDSVALKLQEDVRSNALVELTDKAPTFLELAGLGIPERMHGRSLAPLLRRERDKDCHRDFVRCEYYDALEEPDHSCGTMFHDARHKLVLYHGHGLGELYDLEEDPNEFENIWDEPEAQPLKLELMQRSFDESALHMDKGPVAWA
jgi:arylsulfatase